MIRRPERERWAELRAEFDRLVELGEVERAARLAEIGARDAEARRRLEQLLAADLRSEPKLERIEAVFDRLAAGAARRVTGEQEPGERAGEADTLGLTGRTVSHFLVLEPLATGGMGVVYRAEDLQLGRTIALKFPLPDRRPDARVRERFLREAKIAGGLDHPNLCSIHEAGETEDGQLYLVMPLYGGETLRERIARAGALPATDALAIATQVARGLAAAHRAGIVHRDLKPANIALLPDGGLKILDFGLARADELALTTSHLTLGTVSYMAPEQVRGEPLDARTDLWALGVLLYEMLSGHRPFQRAYDVATLHAIVHDEPAPLGTLRPEVDGELSGLVHRLLAKDPAQRPGSAEGVSSALASLERGQGSSVSGAAPPGAVASPASTGASAVSGATARWRRPRALALGAIFVLALPALAFAGWTLLKRPAAAGTSEPLLLAVLPLASRGGEESEYLAAGLGDAIATQLARLRGLVVPSELSTSGYRSTDKPWPRIARELNAAAVLRGSVERRGDSVQVELELLDVASGQRRWSHRYLAATAGLLELQRAAAGEIVSELDVPTSAAERALLEALPTTSPEAFDAYLRARAIMLRAPQLDVQRLPREDLQRAQSLYARARDLDPRFAIARARLAMSHMYSAGQYDSSTARREQARLEAETALRLQPGLPEAHDALAFYWRNRNDWPRTIAELEQALRGFPNSGDVLLNLGLTYRRVGRWDDAIGAMERAIRFEPRYAGALLNAAVTYGRLRRYEQASAAWLRLVALDPAGPYAVNGQLIRGHALLRHLGTPDSLAAALTRIPRGWDDDGMATWGKFTVLRTQRRPAAALAMLDSARHPISRDAFLFWPVPLMRARVWESLGRTDSARASYQLAHALLADSAAARPRDSSILISLGVALAGLGRHAEALAAAQRALDLVPLDQDGMRATAVMGGAVDVFIMAGEHDRALELLELMLTIPAGREVSVPLLRVDPVFDPLRADPRFESLLERFSTT